MTVSEVLDVAADLIEEKGWVRNSYGTMGGAMCVSSAISCAAIQTGLDRYRLLAKKELGAFVGENWVIWNDDICLDQAEAVNTLRKAAEAVL